MLTADLPLGPIDYRDIGPSDSTSVVVFAHALLVDGTVWDPVVDRLADAGVRCIVPTWPIGSHRAPIPEGRELSPRSVAESLGHLLDHLDLSGAVLVGNDTGGAIVQLALAGGADRVGGLVLVNSDAFETFPPTYFKPLVYAARFRPLVWALAQQTRFRIIRHSPAAYGPLLSRPRSPSLTRGWIEPLLSSAQIRRDLTRFARSLTGDELTGAASWLADFDGPARIVWGTRDRHFKVDLGRRLAAAIPNAELVEVDDARTFVSLDRPDVLAAEILAVTQSAEQIGPTADSDRTP